MIGAVLFDLGNTLVGYCPDGFPPLLTTGIKNVVRCLRRRGLLRLDPEAIAERVSYEDHESPDGRVRPLADRLLRIFDLDEILTPPETLDELCRQFTQPIFDTAKVYDDTIEMLTRLRERGRRIGLVSNTPWGSPAWLWREELERLNLAGLFDAVVFCGDAGWRKPAPRPFLLAAETLGVAPPSCLFVGDRPDWDVRGARAAGMQAVLIDRSCGLAQSEDVVCALSGVLWRIPKPGA